jgi:hypothetical protein
MPGVYMKIFLRFRCLDGVGKNAKKKIVSKLSWAENAWREHDAVVSWMPCCKTVWEADQTGVMLQGHMHQADNGEDWKERLSCAEGEYLDLGWSK